MKGLCHVHLVIEDTSCSFECVLFFSPNERTKTAICLGLTSMPTNSSHKEIPVSYNHSEAEGIRNKWLKWLLFLTSPFLYGRVGVMKR